MAGNVTLPGELFDQASMVAEAEGKTLNDFTAEAVQRQLARCYLNRMEREALLRRGSITEQQVEEIVSMAIWEVRHQPRGQ